MDILLINRWYPIGGVGNYMRILSTALADLGHSVSIITMMRSNGRPKISHDPRINVYSIPYPSTHYYLRRLPVFLAQYRFVETVLYAFRVEKMRQKLEQNDCKFDIVEYADIYAEGLFHLKKAIPYVVTLHMPVFVFADILPGSLNFSTYWISRFERKFIQRASGIMSPSKDLACRTSVFCNIDVKKINIIVNPIAINEISPTVVRSKSSKLNIIYIGYLDHNKGAFLMAEAIPLIVQKCPHAYFTFLGHNRSLSNSPKAYTLIKKIIRPVSLAKIHFTGHVKHADVIKIIQSADICVTPSFYENCPYSALEIMACKKPIVATRNSGFVEMIEDGKTGLLFKPGSAKDLADKILQFVNSSCLRTKTGQKAFEWVKSNYGAPLIAEKKLNFYKNTIKSRYGMNLSI